MLGHAQLVDSHQYVVYEGKIGYKYMDGIHTNSFYGYLTAFAYKKECEIGNISLSAMMTNLNLGGITWCCISYAEIPSFFYVILGVTGTLHALRPEETKVLEEVYDITKFAYIPYRYVYEKNKLGFVGDNPRGKSRLWELTRLCTCINNETQYLPTTAILIGTVLVCTGGIYTNKIPGSYTLSDIPSVLWLLQWIGPSFWHIQYHLEIDGSTVAQWKMASCFCPF
jgi:hypothetical protein